MSASMARRGGQVQPEQSDMRLALNTGKMAKEGFSRTVIEETKYLIKKPRTEVREEKKRGVEFPQPKELKVGKQRHPAMLHQNQTSGGLSLPKWHLKESADMLEMQRYRCASTRRTQRVDSRADSTTAWNATRTNR